MTLRARVRLVAVLVGVGPVVALGLALRPVVTSHFTVQYDQRVDARVASLERALARERTEIRRGLTALTAGMEEDNRLRSLVTGGGPDRTYLVEYGERAMGLLGLDALVIQNAAGRILTSGHFRNEFDRLDPDLPARMARHPDGALLEVRTPDDRFLTLAVLDSLTMGPEPLTVIGGRRVQRWLAAADSTDEVRVSLVLPGGADSAGAATARVSTIEVPFIGDATPGREGVARVLVRHDTSSLDALLSTIDRFWWLAMGGAAVLAVGLAAALSSRITRPLTRLADESARVDLDRLELGSDSERPDEVGMLARTLRSMIQRLRASREQLREAERRAAVGDLARQVNHDIKNGLIPIRNVVRHLAELSVTEPERVGTVFAERRSTLDASIAYLESLSASYARLSPSVVRRPCDVNAIASDVVRDLESSPPVELQLGSGIPPVDGDPVMLRRVFENLLSNAQDAAGADGRVAVRTRLDEAGVEVDIADTGPGMTADQLDRAFEAFYTSKPQGTGLGLPIVRRLVTDMGGSVRIATEPGEGTTVTVAFPRGGTR